MKTITSIFFFLAISISLSAQNIVGQWNGVLEVQGTKLRIVFHISKTESGFAAVMDSPDQGAKAIPIKEVNFENSVLKLSAPNLGLEYVGTLNADQTIKGDFKQGGQHFPMILSRGEEGKPKAARPQTPVEPYPYYVEDVIFTNKTAQIELSGTLTLPKAEGTYPTVVLISGSGPQNRNEEMFGHAPFLVLADFLTRNGFGVLRFDDRGVAKSGGNFQTATTRDFATDVESAVSFLKTRKGVNPKKIGLIGHSEGGLIAPMVAAKDKSVSFIVLLAGPAVPISELMLLQKEQVERQMGIAETEVMTSREIFKGAYELIKKSLVNDGTLQTSLNTYFKERFGPAVPEKDVQVIIKQITSPWWYQFIRLDPTEYLKQVKVPILALNGELDLQVSAKENLQAIRLIVEQSGIKKSSVNELPKLNHLFQESKTGAIDEYSQIEQSFSPLALNEILNWMKRTVK
ncbi:MAG: alpha/beta fold hydrolase [Sphingobacteriales bacterium]|nr:MAG: alpha/beta fold hydrolase [Sphingobacteriales bacterium]